MGKAVSTDTGNVKSMSKNSGSPKVVQNDGIYHFGKVPYDVVLFIFYYLDWDDVPNIKRICKLWHRCTKDKRFTEEFNKSKLSNHNFFSFRNRMGSEKYTKRVDTHKAVCV